MSPEEKLMKQAINIIQKRGRKGLKLAQKIVKGERVNFRPLHEALTYFMKDWEDVVHPGLLSLACEAVGGSPNSTTELGASIALLAGGADVQDDVIDQSRIKNAHMTVFGKFGKDIAILTGDILLLEGLYLLHRACESFDTTCKNQIFDIVKRAFFSISSAEAEEASIRGNFNITSEEYFKIIETKVAVAEATTKIGAIIGNGTAEQIEAMSNYGKTYGILLAVRDEFIDIYDPIEVKNRAENECLPLPILVTFKSKRKKKKITELLKRDTITDSAIDQILETVACSKHVQTFKKGMFSIINKQKQQLAKIKNSRKTLELLLTATMEDL